MREPAHISREARVAERVVAVGDPGRARLLAGILEDPRLESDRRGLLVYTGKWRGVDVTIATHGMGAPSALIVFEELYMLGARIIVRLGTAGGLPGRAGPGSIVVASSAAMVAHGCGLEAYTPGLVPPLGPDPLLASRLYEALRERGFDARIGPVFCSDSFYAEAGLMDRIALTGALAVEMESAALFALSHIRGFRSAGVFIVSNMVGGGFLPAERLGGLARAVGSAILDVLVDHEGVPMG